MGRAVRAAALASVATVLTMLVVAPLIEDRGWLRPVVLVVLAIGLVAAGGGVLRWPAWLVPPACLLAAVVVSTALLVPSQAALLGFVPTPASLEALWLLTQDGVATANQVEPPAPASAGITGLLTVSAAIVGTATVVVAGPLHRPGVAGLPLLLVVCVATALSPAGIGIQGFLLAAVGYLALALCDAGERLSSWGTQLRRRDAGGRLLSSGVLESQSRPALVAAAVAIGAGLTLPVLLPGVSSEGLRTLVEERFGSGGTQTVSTVNPYLSIRDDLERPEDAPVVRYVTDDPTPDPLRILTADSFDLASGVWSPTLQAIPREQNVAAGMPNPPGTSQTLLTTSPTYLTDYDVVGLAQTQLPLPYPVQRVDAPGTWLYDATTLNVIGQDRTTDGLQYSVVSYDIRPTREQLAAAGTGQLDPRWTELPAELPEAVARTAAEVVAGASTPYGQAEALQAFFRETGGFEYSLDAPRATDGDTLTAFLTTDRAGYCVQFASTMALMARTLDIPARVAIGFLPGSRVGAEGYLISTQDAHAWPELYFEGIGWVRFEPTPGSRTGAAPQWTSNQPGGEDEAAEPEPLASASEPAAPLPQEADLPVPAAGEQARTGASAVPVAALGWLVLLLALGAGLLLIPRAWRSWRTSRRRAAAGQDPARVALACWAELGERLGDLGADTGGGTVRRQQSELLEREELDPPAREALGRLVEAAQRALYAVEPAPADGLDADVEVVLACVARHRSRLRRLRAQWLPRLRPGSTPATENAGSTGAEVVRADRR